MKEGKAELIHSANYGKDTELLGFTDKIRRLERQAALNDRTKVNSVHISLNFDPSEKLAIETLRQIADSYMERIGFGKQPYLVYKHLDAGHPHIHIISTNIEADGKRIGLHNIGRDKSEKARKEIEQDFKLVKAEGQRQPYELQPVSLQKIQYGKIETKRAISNILNHILPTYKYASLPELNAILRQYNIAADRGTERSRVFQNNGLVYRILDEKGEKIGVPVKASLLHLKGSLDFSHPTLEFLQSKFVTNEPARQPHKQHFKNKIDYVIAKYGPASMDDFSKALQKEKIHLAVRQNANGLVYGLTYVDHEKKCVFNGSDLGKPYSAQGILIRINSPSLKEPALKPADNHLPQSLIPKTVDETAAPLPSIKTGLLDILMTDDYSGGLNPELKDDLKKRRRKKHRF